MPLSITLLLAAAGIPRFLPNASPRRVVRVGLLAMFAGQLAAVHTTLLPDHSPAGRRNPVTSSRLLSVSTHLLAFSDVVVKRFRSCDRGEHRREWLGLRLLDRHSPGLAPRPLSADFAADPPAVTMSRLPGEPLGGRPLTQAELTAVAGAVDRLHAAVPAGEAARLDPSHGPPHRGLAVLRDQLDAHPGSPDEPTGRRRGGQGWERDGSTGTEPLSPTEGVVRPARVRTGVNRKDSAVPTLTTDLLEIDDGPRDGRPVVPLHGWPDIRRTRQGVAHRLVEEAPDRVAHLTLDRLRVG